MIEHKASVLIFFTTMSETFIMLRRMHRDIIINVHMSSRKEPFILVKHQLNLNILDRFSKNL